MKKHTLTISIVLTVLFVLVSGFFIFRRDDTEQIQVANYQAAYSRLTSASEYLSTPTIFSYSIQTQLLPVGGKYLVTLSIDSATMRMENIVFLVAEATVPIAPRYYPSVGIFQDFGMVLIPQDAPRQTAKETKGINLSFQTLVIPTQILLYCSYETSGHEPITQLYRLDASIE